MHSPIVAVVDDDASVRLALQRLLRAAGMDAKIYASGEEFLAAIHQSPPDCVVLDVRMPGLSGPEVQVQLWASNATMPVIYITAHKQPLPPRNAAAADTVAFLEKPFEEKLLLEAVSRAAAWRLSH